MSDDTDAIDAGEIPPPHPRWCFGLPLAGVAPIEPHEREAVRRRRKALVASVAGYAALTLAVPVVCLLALEVPGIGESVQVALGVTGVLTFLLGAAATALATLEGAREGSRLRRDVSAGEVLVFRGETAVTEIDEEDPQPTAELRVLPASRMWLRPDARGTTLRSVRIQHAAPPPSYAWRVALHDDLVPRGASRDLRFEQRRLTPSEGREILAYARRLVVPGLGEIAYALCASLISMSVVRAIALDPKAVPAGEGLTALASLAFFPIVIFLYVRRVRLSRKLRVDLQAGRAVTAVPTADTESRARATVREFLPVSGITWTFAGRPAAWRDAPPDGPSAILGA